jgi:hypothetical protein
MKVDYILTTFSPTMVGEGASVYMKTVSKEDAKELIDETTQIVSKRESHENMARNLFGDRRNINFADLGPGKSAILIHYRGAPVPENGHTPKGGIVTLYLIEVEEYESSEGD